MIYPKKIWHEKVINLPVSPVSCSHFTLGNPKVIFNNTTNTYFWLFALSQRNNAPAHRASDTVELLSPSWDTPVHQSWHVVSQQSSSISGRLPNLGHDRGARVSSTNPRYRIVAASACCVMDWNSAERGGRCDWSMAKKFGNV